MTNPFATPATAGDLAAPPVPVPPPPAAMPGPTLAVGILGAISVSHLLNDLMQSVVVAMYPLLADSYRLSYHQIGLITCTNQVTASLLQPLVGAYTDRRPQAYSLSIGMGSTFAGLIILAVANNLPLLLLAAGCVGIGSAVFHPEASRIARLSSGGRHGFAQSVFQVGGNLGSALGPLLAAWLISRQATVAWFSLAALTGSTVLLRVGAWYKDHVAARAAQPRKAAAPHGLSRGQVGRALAVLGVLVFSKYVYLASLTNFYTFFLKARFGLSTQASQLHLFILLFAVAAGTIIGGPVGDRIGRKRVIWASILGIAPFAIALPYANLVMADLLVTVIGVVLASAFSAILVFAQELVPGRVGMISGLFFGGAFGIAGIAAALLGGLADQVGIVTVFAWCSWLPLLGLATAFLPDLRQRPAAA
jgi:FSR family fosmidomycin resistance protein-like MFS transporter